MLDSDWVILIVNNLEPIVIAVIGGIVAAIYKRITGRNVEGIHRQALHMAIQTVVRSFVNKWLRSHPGKTVADLAYDKEATNQLRDVIAPSYLVQSVPEAMKKLSPLPNVLDDLIISYLPFPVDEGRDRHDGR